MSIAEIDYVPDTEPVQPTDTELEIQWLGELEAHAIEVLARISKTEKQDRLDLAETLFKMHSLKKGLGRKGGWSSYFKSLRLDLTERSARRYIKIWEAFKDHIDLQNRFSWSAMLLLSKAPEMVLKSALLDAAKMRGEEIIIASEAAERIEAAENASKPSQTAGRRSTASIVHRDEDDSDEAEQEQEPEQSEDQGDDEVDYREEDWADEPGESAESDDQETAQEDHQEPESFEDDRPEPEYRFEIPATLSDGNLVVECNTDDTEIQAECLSELVEVLTDDAARLKLELRIRDEIQRLKNLPIRAALARYSMV